MDKTEMMLKFEAETGEKAKKKVLVMYSTKRYGWGRERNSFFFTNKFVEWLLSQLDKYQAKASAYDRLMSGGRKTLKEWANILGKPVAIDIENRLCWFPKKPEIGLTTWIWYDEQFGCFGEYLPKNLICFTGDWKDSLTLPDGLEEK